MIVIFIYLFFPTAQKEYMNKAILNFKTFGYLSMSRDVSRLI